jgi:predicted transcriptional regulator
MENLKLCESDYRFMTVIWDNEPLQSTKLVELCDKRFGWKKSTTFTMIKKLTEKGFAQNINSVVSSLIPRDRVQAFESERFIAQFNQLRRLQWFVVPDHSHKTVITFA